MNKWLAGLALAVLTTVIAGLLTGAISFGGRALREKVNPSEPLNITYTRHPLSRQSYIVPRPIAEIDPPGARADQKAWDNWAASLGAVDASVTTLQVVVTGRTSDVVVLQDLRVRIVDRRPPLPGTYISWGVGAGGVFERWLTVDLDSDPPSVVQSVDQRYLVKEGVDNPIHFPYKVSASEPEVFHLIVNTKDCDCSWIAELDYTAGSKRGTVTIGDRRNPFRTTARTNAPGYISEYGEDFKPLP